MVLINLSNGNDFANVPGFFSLGLPPNVPPVAQGMIPSSVVSALTALAVEQGMTPPMAAQGMTPW